MVKEVLKKTSKTAGIASSVSGSASFLGGYQVCHQVCMGLIGLLSLVGITIVGMPLAFLLPYAVPFWIIGFVLFLITLVLFVRMPQCISKNLLLLNAGLLMIAIPFKELQSGQIIFWFIGSILILIAVYQYLQTKFQKIKPTT